MEDRMHDRGTTPERRLVSNSTPDEVRTTASSADRQHSDRLVTLGHLAATAAHDINGQLVASHHAIHTALHIVRGIRAQVSDRVELERLEAVLDDAERASARIASITSNMTIYARSPGDAFEPVRLDLVARDALRVTSSMLAGRARVVECLQPVPAIPGRTGALVQVAVNLLINAIHALDANRPGIVQVETRADAACVRLAVQDDGRGVAPDLRTRIFDPYFTTKAPGVGTGLGLSICREIAAEHGGRIELVAGAEPGARFELTLPLAPRTSIDAG